MTVGSYKKWKAGKHITKAKLVIDFYKTNPTIEQERLRSKQIVVVGSLCTFSGSMMGIGIGYLIAMLL